MALDFVAEVLGFAVAGVDLTAGALVLTAGVLDFAGVVLGLVAAGTLDFGATGFGTVSYTHLTLPTTPYV